MKRLLDLLKAPLNWIVVRLFNNRIGLRRNLRYERYQRHCRRKASIATPPSLPAQMALADLWSTGLCILPPPISSERVAAIAGKASGLLADPRRRHEVSEIEDFAVHLKDCYKVLPEMIEFLTPEVVSVVEAYYRTHLKIYSAEVSRSLQTNKAPVLSWLWHTDDHPAPILKIMVYLTEVTESTGAFRAFDRPTSRALLRKGFRRERAESFGRELSGSSHLVVAEGPPGTVVIFDNNLVHRATAPRVDHRDVIVFEVLPSPEPFAEHLARVGTRLSAEYRGSDYPQDPFRD